MAEFNPFLPQSNIPNWADASGRLRDGSAFGDIFANTAVQIGKAAGEENVRRTTKDLYGSAEAAGEEGRLDSLATSAGVPLEVARGMAKPELWKKAFEKGNYSDSMFYTKMDVWAKQMKAKYPNYVDEIDKQTARVMGRTPANEQLDSVRKSYEDALAIKNSAESKELTWRTENAAYIDPDMLKNWDNLPDEARKRAMTDALIRKSGQAQDDLRVKNAEASQKFDAVTWSPILAGKVENLQRDFWMGAVKDAGGNYASLQATIQKMAEGGFSPDELRQISQIVAQKKQDIMNNWTSIITEQQSNGKSIQDILAGNPDLFNTQKARVDEMLKGLDDLAQGKTGYVDFNSTMAEAERDQRTKKMIDAFGKPAYDGFKGLQEMLPPDIFTTVVGKAMQEDPKGGGGAIQSVANKIVIGLMQNGENIGSATNKVVGAADPSLLPQVAKASRQAVETSIDLATNAKVPLDQRKKSLQAILGDTNNEFIRTLKDTPDSSGMSSREKFYARMLSPEVAKSATDMGMGKQYTEWLKSSGVALLAGNIEQVNATNKSTKYMDIAFNPNTMQFEARMSSLVKDPRQMATYLSNRRAGNNQAAWRNTPQNVPLEDLDAITYGIDSVQKMNLINKGLVQAIKADKPGISNEDLAKELQQYYGDLQKSYQKEDPWQSKAWASIKEGLYNAVTGKTAVANNKVAADFIRQQQYGADFGVVPTGDTNFVAGDGTDVGANATQPSTGDQQADKVLSFIQKAEGANYNTVYGGGTVDASTMTVQDVLDRKGNAGSSAFGAYQVVNDTLKGLVDKGVVSATDQMNQATQDKIGMALLKDAGYDDWKAGSLTTKKFADKLMKIWASIPNADGESHYAKDGVNKATVTRSEVMSFLSELQG